MTWPKKQAARRIAYNNHAAKRRAVNGASKRAKRLVLSNALKADICAGKFIMQKKSRYTALKEIR